MKAEVVRLDTLDDRREVATSLLHSLTPDDRVAFLEWVCRFAWLTCPAISAVMSYVRPDYWAMIPVLYASRRGDRAANVALCNAVWTDLFHLSHQHGVDYLACLVELENWAKGRERTPVEVAAKASEEYRKLQSGLVLSGK